VNQKQLYVSISRARLEAQVVTNDKKDLARSVSRDVPKSTALETLRVTEQREWRHEPAERRRAVRETERAAQDQEPDRGLEWGR
jgi:hypothetical protein